MITQALTVCVPYSASMGQPSPVEHPQLYST